MDPSEKRMWPRRLSTEQRPVAKNRSTSCASSADTTVFVGPNEYGVGGASSRTALTSSADSPASRPASKHGMQWPSRGTNTGPQ